MIGVDPSGRLRGPTAWLLVVTLMAAGALAAAAWTEHQQRVELEANLERATGAALARIEQILDEFRALAAEIPSSGDIDCSTAQLERMRRQLFGLDFLRDIGIVRDRTLFCSTTLGVIDDPVSSSAPDLILADGIELYAYRSVRLSLNRPTMVLQLEHMNALVDPVLVEGLSSSPWLDALQISDIARTDWFALYGAPGNVPVTAPGSDLLVGVRCSSTDGLCLRGLTSPARADGPVSSGRLSFVVLGAVAGLSVVLLIQLATLGYCTPSMRIRRALASGAIKARYQPIFEANSGRLVGIETLARWPRGPAFLRPPEAFVSAAENGGLARRLTRRMIENVAGDLGRWLAARPEVSVAINISAQDLEGGDLGEALERHLIPTGVAPGQVVLEITERSLVGMHGPIERLVERGYSVHVDDFGEGYSSLAYLHELPLHGVKISRTFVSSLGTDSPKAVLVASMVQMAEQLNLEVVLEGIETERQRQAAARLGEVTWQGFLFARPMSADSLKAFEAALSGDEPDEDAGKGA
nr:EAL domain-containing protein [Wenzhouxiangella sp. XN79A]